MIRVADGAAGAPPPPLDYAQLFSFQIAFRDGGSGGGKEWEKAILEVNFAVRTFILLDRERVVVARPFDSYTRCAFDKDVEDPFVSLFFGLLELELNVQNSAEKECMLHLLQCIAKNMTAVEAVRQGIGIVGLDKRILKYGIILRKAKAKRRRTERFLVVVPGKLLMFAGTNILGRHVRSVTSLFRANVKMSFNQLEFQIIAHHSKEKEMSSWITALEESIQRADQVRRATCIKPEVESSKTLSVSEEEDRKRARRPLRPRYSDQLTGTSNETQGLDEPRVSVRQFEDEGRTGYWRRCDNAFEEGHRRVSLSRERLKAAIEDMSDMISRLNVRKRQSFPQPCLPENYVRLSEAYRHREHRPRRQQQTDSSSENFYTNAVCRAAEESRFRGICNSSSRHRRRRRKEPERYYRNCWDDPVAGGAVARLDNDGSLGNRNNIEAFRESWKQQPASSMIELPERRRSLAPFISRKVY
ncbi:uncharacterized protein LOC112342246 [Selaginella moellendorffii]|uniref:uncharacterized protein LOC112342246 n=1 Tax=Selaginella moellendorffii TaxID=88036 RepID=UPI000D1CF95D|nr:uncharacterized protein LOC112342246 [Selaginella moellendorffii]|eukprot:XP_024519552.1 uncharacterized protein LOC112342246 [Selaginella moellendorffii]